MSPEELARKMAAQPCKDGSAVAGLLPFATALLAAEEAMAHAEDQMDCWTYNPKTNGCRPGAICPPCLTAMEIHRALSLLREALR